MKKERNTVLLALFALFVLYPVKGMAQNIPPIANAGSSRYAAQDPIVLDGTGSYDPDNSGTLSYTWRQITGPPVVIIDANTAIPTIGGSMQPSTGRDPVPTVGGFAQTDEIQECEFELVVSDGELTSLPDTVKVIIVPDFGANTLWLENPPFDRHRPTVVYFGGGDCITGGGGYWGNSTSWAEKANIIRTTYGPDTVQYEGWRTYYRMGDMIIVYLSSVAPEYAQLIQTIGWSTGGQPAMDVGIRLNRVYKDIRYAINHVTLLDAPCRFLDQSPYVFYRAAGLFLTSAVGGEQCWIDNYWGSGDPFEDSITNHMLDVWLQNYSHGGVEYWYKHSLVDPLACNFNGGIVGGAYWSVVGPGKNLQRTQETAHQFRWSTNVGMSLFKETKYPGRFPEPVHLTSPADGSFVDANGAVFSCEESENAVGYQLLFGPDPYRVMDYYIISDTSSPPAEVITSSPFVQTWWTVKVYDQYGSTIYADPIRVIFENLDPPLIENITTGQRYASIRHAIDDARNGHEIVVSPGVHKGNITFKGKNLTVRSTDPSDSAVVAATVINGGNLGSAVTFSNSEDVNCVLAGFTITDANNGIYCSGASPTIINCDITANAGAGIELYNGSNPIIANCCIAANAGAGIEMLIYKSGRIIVYNYPTITNCTIAGNLQHGISGGIPTIMNSIIWANSPQQIADTQGTFSVTYSNVQGGWLGESNIDTDPLFADPENNNYHLKSQAGRWDQDSQTWIIDEATSPCIDAGDPSSPVGLEPLPNGGIINMGAYGGTAEASKSLEN